MSARVTLRVLSQWRGALSRTTSKGYASAASVIAPGSTRIGWIGTGVMGRWMCQHCMDAGFSATVFNRTMSKAQPLADGGATLAGSVEQVAQESDVIFTILGYPHDVKDIVLDKVVPNAKPGSVIVDMTTSEPSLAMEIADAAAKRDVQSIDAPVSGGDVGAKAGKLAIMVGGDQDTVKRLDPLFSAMGSAKWMGGPGMGQHTKVTNQILICTTMIGLCEGLLYAYRAGLDLTQAVEAVAGGAAGSKSLDLYSSRIISGDYAPGFYVDYLVKDLAIALAESKRLNLKLPGLELAHKLYVALQEQGDGRKGTHALQLALARLNNIDFKP